MALDLSNLKTMIDKMDTHNNTINQIPDCILLELFSYLSAKDIQALRLVCRHWYHLSLDNLLWKQRLIEDLPSWNVIPSGIVPFESICSQPDLFFENIYSQCCPELLNLHEKKIDVFHRIIKAVLSLGKPSTPKIVLLGSGLENSTRSFFSKMVHEDNQMFSLSGMFPGKYGGMGSGFHIKRENNSIFDLMPLYSNTYQLRKINKEYETGNRLIQKASGEDGSETYGLNPSLKLLSNEIDAVVFAVDCLQLSCGWDLLLLKTLMKEIGKSKKPLLVLNLHMDTVNYVPCIDIVDTLQLHSLENPWQAHSCTVGDLAGFREAFHWLFNSIENTNKAWL